MVSASLHFGEIKWDTSTYDDGRNPVPVSVKNMEVVNHIAGLLGVKPDDLIENMVNKPVMQGISERVPEKPQVVEATA